MSDQIRVAIADGQPIFRLGVKTLFALQPGLEVVGEAATTTAAIEMVGALSPDILLTDHTPPRLDGLAILRHLQAAPGPTRVILLAAAMRETDIQAALFHGAWGLVLKGSATTVLPHCIRQVMQDQHWVGTESVNALVGGLRAPVDSGTSSLTAREIDIVRWVARGASNRDIAAQLSMGEQTVKNHMRRIFRKLRVANRVELALLAIEQDVARPDDAGPTA